MPIKLPRGFNRRKSSVNALEEVQNPPEPTFRVFERQDGGGKSFDGGNALKRMNLGRPLSVAPNFVYQEEVDGRPASSLAPSNRASGGTNNSSSSGGLYDTSSSSARFSSSSTLPSSSSFDAVPDEYSHAHPKPQLNKPTPPIPASQPAFSLRAARKTLSFGGRKASPSMLPTARPDSRPTVSPSDAQSSRNITRQRALTESSYASASTATPPKLLDTDLDFGHTGDSDFGNMFEALGNRRSKTFEGGNTLGVPATASSESIFPADSAVAANNYFSGPSPYTPPPQINADRSRDLVSSPFSTFSHDSREGLISSSSPINDHPRYDYNQSPPVPRHQQNPTISWRTLNNDPDNSTNPAKQQRPESALRRSSAYESRRGSTPSRDQDALLISDSVNASRRLNRQSVAFESSPPRLSGRDKRGAYESIGDQSPSLELNPQTLPMPNRTHSPVELFDSEGLDLPRNLIWEGESTETTPRAKMTELATQDEPLLFNQSLHSRITSVGQIKRKDVPSLGDRSPSKNAPQGKVMTPGQFEMYKKEQELSRTMSNASKSKVSDDGSDNDDEDDEAERNRQLAKQRRKQQAHLAVYRQQMMKVTGEQPADLPNFGQPRLGSGKPASNEKNSDDEDEDIPLGILAAHGFPAKNRPPTHLSKTGGAPSIRYNSETYPPPPASIAGESMSGRPRSNLPAFAKNLPRDPYYGASLVNPSSRESMGFANSGGASAYGGSQSTAHPGGLVGVIAGEERARASRRGSSNATGGFPDPNMPPGGMPQMSSNMMHQMGMMPPGMPMVSPNDQAQIQMSQQMNQMMQMQMQFMQQMMAMQGNQSGQQQPPQMHIPSISLQNSPMMPNNGFLSPGGPQMHRPMSMGSASAPTTPGGLPPHLQHRSMSMLDSQIAQQWGNRTSMAPSMMSGALGPPQGYTPSIAPSERSNVGMPSRYRPVSIAPIDEISKKDTRASTLSGATALNAWNSGNNNNQRTNGGQTTVKIVVGGGGYAGHDNNKLKTTGAQSNDNMGRISNNKTGSDDDEAEGWEELRKKAERKKGTWRLRKDDGSGLGDVHYPGTQGMYPGT